MPHEPVEALAPGRIDSHAFADALAQTTQSLVCVLDRSGRILVFNEACERATGFRGEDVVGKDARESVIPPEQAQAFGEVLDHVWTTGLPSAQVGNWVTRDGGRLLIAWSNKPLPDSEGRFAYLVASGLDITDRERADAERRALEGDLAAKLAEVGRLAQEQAALRRVATLVAAEVSPERVFEAVSEQSARVLGTGAAAVFKFERDGATIVGRYDREGIDAFGLGSTVPFTPHSAIGRVHATGEPARIDDYSELPGEVADLMRRAGVRFTVAGPITAAGRLWGAVAVTSKYLETPPPESEARLRDFCELVSLAVESAESREELRASRTRIVQAADDERRRLERNLHDGAQQRLVSLALVLRLARNQLASDPQAAASALDAAGKELDSALDELRELAHGLHPGILIDRGLAGALEALAERTQLPVVVAEVPPDRLARPIEVATYYIVAEAVTNVAKHAHASKATVAVRTEGDVLRIEISDDGRGGADDCGSGIVGLRDRAEALGGSLTIDSPPGAGTVVRAELPAYSAGAGSETASNAADRD